MQQLLQASAQNCLPQPASTVADPALVRRHHPRRRRRLHRKSKNVRYESGVYGSIRICRHERNTSGTNTIKSFFAEPAN